jgi:hypothetical protein
MRIPDRASLATLLDPSNAVYVEGDEQSRKQARDAWHRHRYVGQVMSSSLEELPASTLKPRPFGILEGEDGRLYRPRRDGLIDVSYVPTAIAYFCDSTGLPILLEPAPGAATRAEAEEQQAARRAQRAAPKPKPNWAR